MKMTELSKQNLLIAESVQLEPVDGGGFMLRVKRGDSIGYISGRDGIVNYKTPELARRAVKRLRPDLPLTSI